MLEYVFYFCALVVPLTLMVIAPWIVILWVRYWLAQHGFDILFRSSDDW